MSYNEKISSDGGYCAIDSSGKVIWFSDRESRDKYLEGINSDDFLIELIKEQQEQM